MSNQGTNSPKRLRWLARGGLLWAFLLGARLVSLQVVDHDKYLKLAERNQLRTVVAEAARGEILDRNGRVLAMNVPAKSALLNTEAFQGDLRPLIKQIAKAIGMDAGLLAERVRAQQAAGAMTVEIKRGLMPEQVEALEALNIDALAFRAGSRRIYPNGAMAANVLGWVNESGEGAAGLELAHNKLLLGKPGEMRLVMDARKQRASAEITEAPRPGQALRTTLDARIQNVADESLKKAVIDNHATTGSVVVMNPRTGEVLAMSSYPTFDPNEPVHKSAMASRVNQAVSNVFEPGSVFKVITFASAIENIALKPSEIIPCGNGVARLFGGAVIIHDHDSYSSLSAEDVLAKSSNVGTINIALRVGLDKIVSGVRNFGFGKRTGVGLPGESPGLVPKYKNSSIGYVSIGHEVAVTNLQLARAASAVANGGLLIKPRLTDPTDDETQVDGERVIRPETAIQLRQMMERVVLAGTGTRAKFAGYTAGGKTGSAQIFDFSTNRYSHTYNASFMGFTPVTNPDVVVMVTLNGVSQFGGVLAAPVFKEIASAAMRVRQIHRDVPDEVTVPAMSDRLLADASAAPEKTAFSRQELVMDPVSLFSDQVEDSGDVGPRVPDFRGKSLTSVVSQSVALGLKIATRGQGLVRQQAPAPGTILPAGSSVQLTFAP